MFGPLLLIPLTHGLMGLTLSILLACVTLVQCGIPFSAFSVLSLLSWTSRRNFCCYKRTSMIQFAIHCSRSWMFHGPTLCFPSALPITHSALVHSGCSSKIPDRVSYKSRHLLLTALKARNLRSGCQHGWMRALFGSPDFFMCFHMAEEQGISLEPLS